MPQEEIAKVITQLELAMDLAASKMDFEKAAELRDQIDVLQEKLEKKKH